MFKILVITEEKNIGLLDLKFRNSNIKDLSYIGHDNLVMDSDFFISFNSVVFQLNYPLFEVQLDKVKQIRDLFPGILIVVDHYNYYKNRYFMDSVKVDLYYPLVDGIDGLVTKCRQLLVSKFMFAKGSICYKDIILDIANHSCIRSNKKIKLRNREFELLKFFLENPKKIFSSSQLLEAVWDMNSDLNTNTVQSHISFLRKKIDVGFKEKLLHTISCVGYKID